MADQWTEEELLDLARKYSFRSRLDKNTVSGPVLVWGRGSVAGPPARVCGDQNDDRVVDIRDVVIDLRIAVGLVTPSETQRELSDLNRDGEVNAFDAIKGLQRVAGLIASLEECGVPPGSNQPG